MSSRWMRDRAHRADLGSVDACRNMIEALSAVVAGRDGHPDDLTAGAYRETVEHELLRLREMEADYVNDLLSIEEEGGAAVPDEYRAPRGERTDR